MAEREKVIKGLEHCINHDGRACQSCPYVHGDCVDDLCADAIAVLKEQQEQIDKLIEESASNAEMAEGYAELLKEQKRKKGSWDYGTQCSVCKGTIVPPWKRDTRVNFCPWCGADMRDSYEQ